MSRVIVSLLVSAIVVAPLALAEAGPLNACPIKRSGQWEYICAPKFVAGSAQIVAYAADRNYQKRVLVTNGVAVAVSHDGGLSWAQSRPLQDAPGPGNDFSAAETRIKSIVIPTSKDADDVVYLLAEQGGSRARILKSTDGGESWVVADAGLPPQGQPVDLEMSHAYPQILYVMLNHAGAQTLWMTTDGGGSWARSDQLIPPNPDPGLPDVNIDDRSVSLGLKGALVGLEVDPIAPNQVWQFGKGGLYHSSNQGKDPQLVEKTGADIRAVDIFRVAGTSPRIIATAGTSPTAYLSLDGGSTWQVRTTPGIVESIAQGNHLEQFAVATSIGVSVSLKGFAYRDITPPDKKVVTDLTASTDKDFTLYGLTGNSIARLVIPTANTITPPPHGQGIDIDLPDFPPGQQGAGRLTPSDLRLELGKGESKTVDYDLKVLKSPTPLDVYFLTDVSGSMGPSIEGVGAAMKDIITRLTENRVSVQFGVAEYRAYDQGPAYHRLLDIAEPGQPLEEALNNLYADGGGNETQLAALFQTATGAGQNDFQQANSPLRAEIPPNQEANFRGNALKVILHATDETFSTGPPHPTYDQVQEVLNEREIEQIGLAIDEQDNSTVTGYTDTYDPVTGLKEVAKRTQTFAVADTDCDGDGDIDIANGKELVCIIDPERAHEAGLMANAIVGLLESVDDTGTVTFGVLDDPDGIIEHISNVEWNGVDFKTPPTLNTSVVYSCPEQLTEDTVYEAEIGAQSKGSTVAQAHVRLTCTVAPKVTRPELINLLSNPVFLATPAIFPPLLRPPEIPPGTNPQAQAQPQSQAQAQGAFSAQEQEQPQLAYAAAKAAKLELAPNEAMGRDTYNMTRYDGGRRDYRMSRYRRLGYDAVPPPKPPSSAPVLIGAAAMSLIFAFASVSRQQVRTQLARRRR